MTPIEIIRSSCFLLAPMLRVILFRQLKHGLISGCDGLLRSSTFLGHPVTELDTKFGEAFVFGKQREVHLYCMHLPKADWSVLVLTGYATSQVSGYVYGHSCEGTVMTPNSSRSSGSIDAECILKGTANEAGIVTDINLVGDAWACRKFN